MAEADWATLRTLNGTARTVPRSIEGMLRAPDSEVASTRYWELDNDVVVQGQLFEASPYAAEDILERIARADYSAEGLRCALDLLVELASGESDASEVALGRPDLGERCRRVIRAKVVPVLALVSCGDERTAMAVLDLADVVLERGEARSSWLADARRAALPQPVRHRLDAMG